MKYLRRGAGKARGTHDAQAHLFQVHDARVQRSFSPRHPSPPYLRERPRPSGPLARRACCSNANEHLQHVSALNDRMDASKLLHICEHNARSSN